MIRHGFKLCNVVGILRFPDFITIYPGFSRNLPDFDLFLGRRTPISTASKFASDDGLVSVEGYLNNYQYQIGQNGREKSIKPRRALSFRYI